MQGKIAVVGATGRVGRHVVDVLQGRGDEVLAISRSSGADVVTGEGLAEALAGVECVIDVANIASDDQEAATQFFTASARNLNEAGRKAGVQRLIVLSIIGIDRFTHGYYAAKRVHERSVLSGSIPVRILRAAQFHELVGQLVDWGRKDQVSYVPKMRTQLIAARTVAEALVDLATSAEAATSATLEIAGPQPETLIDAATLLTIRRHDPVRLQAVSDPKDPDSPLWENGTLLPGPQATLAGPTFRQWLDAA
jgi:uncharacterized protein YbjT (DUF2867 family)